MHPQLPGAVPRQTDLAYSNQKQLGSPELHGAEKSTQRRRDAKAQGPVRQWLTSGAEERGRGERAAAPRPVRMRVGRSDYQETAHPGSTITSFRGEISPGPAATAEPWRGLGPGDCRTPPRMGTVLGLDTHSSAPHCQGFRDRKGTPGLDTHSSTPHCQEFRDRRSAPGLDTHSSAPHCQRFRDEAVRINGWGNGRGEDGGGAPTKTAGRPQPSNGAAARRETPSAAPCRRPAERTRGGRSDRGPLPEELPAQLSARGATSRGPGGPPATPLLLMLSSGRSFACLARNRP